ncbi:hypothetical protein TNCV_1754201 [Trichonephila clavipes]|nr:hypothetical protein TNCV_1754201 [Trichonephila clavipes]
MKRATAKTKRFCPESRGKGEIEKPLSEQCPRRGQKSEMKRNGTKTTSDVTRRRLKERRKECGPSATTCTGVECLMLNEAPDFRRKS